MNKYLGILLLCCVALSTHVTRAFDSSSAAEFRFSIFIENGANGPSPSPQDMIVTSQAQSLSVVDVEPFPETTPVLIAINAASLSTDDLKRLNKDLIDAATELNKRGINYNFVLIDSTQANYTILTDPSGLPQSLADAISRQISSTDRLEQHLKSLNQLNKLVVDGMQQNSYLRIVLVGRDMTLDTDNETDLGQALSNNFIYLLANHGVPFFFLNYGESPGTFVHLAEQVGGIAMQAGTQTNLFAGALSGGNRKNYLVSVKWEGPQYYFHPLSLSLSLTSSSSSVASLKGPKSFWPLPPNLRPPDLEKLQEAATLRNQLDPQSKPQDLISAVITAQRLVELSPFTLQDRIRLVHLYGTADQFDQAQQLLEQSLSIFPDSWELPYERGLVYEKQNDSLNAIKSFQEALIRKPEDGEIIIHLARLSVKANRIDEAFALYDRLLSAEPTNSSLRIEFANLLWTRGFLDRAESEATRVIESDKAFLPAYDLLIKINLKKQNYAGSLELSRAALNLDANLFTGLYGAGVSLTHLGKHEESLSYLEKAALRDPNNLELQVALYRCYDGLGRLEEAFKSLETAIKIDEKQPELYIALAGLHRKRGDLVAARKALEDGMSKTNGSFALSYSLAQLEERRHEFTSAISFYKAAVSLADQEIRKEILTRVGLLELQQEANLQDSLHTFEDAGFSLSSSLTDEVNEQRSKMRQYETERNQLGKLILPGGIEPILRFAPFLEARKADQSFLSLLFAYLLDSEPLKSKQEDLPRQELISFYREYSKFENWLKKEGLLTPEVVLSFSVKEEDLKRANRILTYFDTRVKTTRDGQGNQSLVVNSPSNPNRERNVILKLLGFNPVLVREGSSFKFEFKDQELPVIFGVDYWIKGIFQKKSIAPDEAILLWLERPESMQLYVSLEQLPNESREWLKRLIPAKELFENYIPGLSAYGKLLRFNPDGSLRIPGGQQGEMLWADLLDKSPAKDQREFLKRLFTKDNGRAIYYFASLSQASPEVLRYFDSSPQRFKRFYSYLPDYGDHFRKVTQKRKFYDFTDLVLLLETDEEGVYFPGTEKMWSIATKRSSSARVNQLDKMMRRRVKVAGDEDLLANLLKTGKEGSVIAGAGKYAILKHLIDIMPDLIDDRTSLALEISYDRFGGQFGLIYDLNLDAEVLLKLLQRVEDIEKGTQANNKRTTLLLFQGTLGLLQALARNHIIDSQQARQLCAEFLNLNYAINDLGLQAFQVSRFLSDRLLPVVNSRLAQLGVTRSEEPFVDALAGSRTRFSFVRNNKTYDINFAQHESQRIRGFLDKQNLLALEPIIRALVNLENLRREPGEQLLQEVSQFCRSLHEPLLEGKVSDVYRKAVIHTESKRLMGSLQKLEQSISRKKVGQINEQISAVADGLAPFLGDSLLGMVYATEVSEDDIVIEADSNFVRKHDFLTSGKKDLLSNTSSWSKPKVAKDDVIGAHMEGSLVGISSALARLKGEQIEGSSTTRFAYPGFPALQRSATALINPVDLTGDVIEYAALSMNLAETLMAAAIVDNKIKERIELYLNRNVGARRAQLIREYLNSARINKAKELFLLSELYHLGDEYFQDQATSEVYPWKFQEIIRLKELAEKVDANGMAQLGFPASSWYGIETLTLETQAPIETMSTYWLPDRLAERSCEFKLQLARLFWQVGLPSELFKPVCNRIISKVIKDVGQVSGEDWMPIIDAFKAVDEKMVIDTVGEIVERWQE